MTAPILQAEIEAVRKRAAVDDREGKLRDIGPRVAACEKDRALLLQALDGVMGKLTRNHLATTMATAQWLKKYPDRIPPMWFVVSVGAPDSDEATHFWRKALISADAIRASLGLTQGSGTE